MRKFSTLLIIVLMLLMLMVMGCASSSHRLVGTWQRVDPATEQPLGKAVGDKPGVTPLKILNKTHFAFGNLTRDGVWAGGGEYALAGDIYSEIIQYHSIPELVGEVVEFDCRLEGDLWYHKARFEAGGQRFNIDEVWRRVGAGEPDDVLEFR